MKKSVKKIFATLLLAFVLLTSAFILESCTPKEEPFVDQGEVGTYVTTVDGDEISLQLDENAFTLTTQTGVSNGKYVFDGTTLTITFDGDNSGVKVNYDTNVLSFTYRGTTYTLYRNLQYTVTFEGTDLQSESVVNGSTCARPADPQKDEYQFIGWYKDSAYTTLFDFDSEIITADTKVYARFEKNENAENEYTVSFVTGENVYFDSVLTYQNTLLTLPEVKVSGKEFIGWFVSNYNDPEKLSYQYETNMEINQDLTLYAAYTADAPTVSVYDDRIMWDAKGVNKTYAVNIKLADDEEAESIASWSGTTTYYNFDWNNVDAGNYIVEVTCGNYTGVAYYANKLLAQVCKIGLDGNKITWKAVEDATSYSITVQCENSSHNHTMLDLGNVTEYDLSNCLMGENGINFTIYANADGYLSSASQTGNFYQKLNDVTNIKVDDANQKLTWDQVASAESYNVTIKDEAGQTYKYTTTETSLDLSDFYGALEVSVTPIAKVSYSVATVETLTKASLATPTNIKLQGYEISWDAVKDAKSYVITVAGKEYTSTTNSYALQDSDIADVTDFTITVKAIADVEANNSLVSKEVTVNKSNVTSIAFNNGVITWSAVPGVSKYAVKVDDGEVQIVSTVNELAYTITSGKHTIYVTVADNNGNYNASNFFSYEVNVYALIFDTQGGYELSPYYYVSGDTIDVNKLPEATRDGYAFLGWYTVEQGSSDESNKFAATTFDFGKDTTIFADWTGNKYTITLDYDVYGTGDTTTVEVYYGTSFVLPVPTATENLKAFGGWYQDPNAAGEKYTDEFGASMRNWRDYQDITLHAGWIDVFTFVEINKDAEGNAQAYSVKKGAGISFVTNITIPTTYNGLPVTTIEAEGFASCTTLVNIYIPESITNVETGSEGPNGTGNCFKGCSKLTKVEVYSLTDDELKALGMAREDVIYSSIDGVLIKNNTITGGVEIAYVPYYTKSGVYTVPDCVTVIPTSAFQSCTKITQLIIPASVKEIDSKAFYGCSGLTKVTFLPADDSADEVELLLGENAFQSCTKLATVELPARLVSFNVNAFTSCTVLATVNIVGEYSNAKYSSYDGVLTNVDKSEIIYFPKGYAGEYTTPVGISKIGEQAFKSCTGLTKITISGQVTEIGKNAFESCTALTEVVFAGTADDARLTICEQAFKSCTGLTTITLPANLKVMEKNAFASCSKLVDVKVYAVDKDIDFATNAFGTVTTTATAAPTFYVTDLWLSKDVHVFDITGVFGANKLANVTVEEGNENYASEDGVLYNKDITEVVYYPSTREGSYTLPDTIVRIGARVFYAKTGILSITIGNKVTEIGESAFYSCTNLTSVTFAEGGTDALTIGSQAFRSCTNLTSLELPDRLTTIGESAFAYCSKLQTITIPSGVKTIEGSAFYYCSKLTSITLPAGLENLVETEYYVSGTTTSTTADQEARIRQFDYCTSLPAITVEEGNEKYQSIDGILYKKVYDEDTKELVGLELAVCPAGKGGVVELPSNITKIDNHAFYYNQNLEGITFPNGVDDELTIGVYSFYYCSKLTSVELPEGLTSLSENSFYYCKALKSITFPSTLSYIGPKAFYYCTNLESVSFAETPEGQTAVPLTIEKGTMSSDSYGTYYYGVFQYCTKITELNLPERLVSIGDYAFAGLTGLKKVTLPSTLEVLGSRAFASCSALESVTFTGEVSKLKEVGTYVFYYDQMLTSIVLPEGLTTMGNYMFYYCKGLTKATLPSTLENVPTYAFYYCSALKEVEWPNGSNIKTIGSYAFAYSAIESIVIPYTIETIDNYAFSYAKSLKSITFEEGENGSNLKSIGTYAFRQTAITKFAFPYCGVDSTGNTRTITIGTSTTSNIFESCKKLTEVYLSEAVTSITNMFVKCGSIKKVTVSEKSENFKAHESLPIIMNVDGTIIQFIYGMVEGTDGVFNIPEGVTEISAYAFSGQTEIKEIVIPKTVKTIGNYAFYNCKGLEKVTFADGSLCDSLGTYLFACDDSLKEVKFPTVIDTIPSYCFMLCSSLESFEFTSNITKIDTYAFANSGLKTVYLPETVTNIGNYAFAYCSDLTSVKADYEDPVFGTYVFYHCESLESAEFKDTCTGFGNYDFAYCTSLKTFTIPTSTTVIANYLFEYSGLTEITIPESVTVIGSATGTVTTASYSFYHCEDLTKVDIKGDVTFIGTYAFESCLSLKEINIPSTVTIIGNYAFRNTAIESVVIPKGVTQLGSAAATGATFANNPSLKTVTFEDGSAIKTIYGLVFQNCTALEEITVPSTVTILGNYVFDGCSSLKKASVLGKIATFGTYVFSNCSSLTDVTFASTQAKLGTGTFKNCSSLETITLPTSLTDIGTYTFQGCTALKEISIPKGVTKLGTSATAAAYIFDGCTSLEKVTLLGAVTIIGTYTFQNCSSLKEVVFSSKNKLTGLGNYAFYNCTSLESIDLTTIYASTYKNIGSSATAGSVFQGCTSLKEVKIPDSVQMIGQSVFQDCTSLTTLTLPSMLTTVGKWAFKGCGVKEYNFGKNATVMAYNVFGNNDGITVTFDSANTTMAATGNIIYNKKTGVVVSVFNGNGATIDLNDTAYAGLTLPSTLSCAFQGSGIDTLILPNGLTTLPTYALAYADIKNVILPDSLTSTGNYAFEYSTIETVTIGSSDLTVGNYAFYYCSNLKEVKNSENITYINYGGFRYTSSLENITLSNKLTQINYYGFADSGLTEITVPGTVTTLGGYTTTTTSTTYGYIFYNCANLKKVVLEEGVTTLLDRNFALSGVEEIVIPSTVTTITNYEFYNCANLKSVDLSNVTSVGTYTFQGCTSLESVKLNENMEAIPNYMFHSCSSLTDINIPSSVTNIGSYAFYKTGIKSVTLPYQLDTLGTYAFSESKLETITIPGTCKLVANYSFKNCTELKTVVLEEGVESIGTAGTVNTTSTVSYTFQGCTALESITIPESLYSIGGYAFDGCTSMKQIVLGDNISYIGRQTFGGWTADQKIYCTQSRFDVTSCWYGSQTYTLNAGYWTTGGAVIEFNYVEQ